MQKSGAEDMRQSVKSKTMGIQAIAEVEDNAVQTSLVYDVNFDREHYSHMLRETLINKRPVYVVYPNYTLPDLSFLNSKDMKRTLGNYSLKPQSYEKDRARRGVKGNRPFSCNDIDSIKRRDFSHVKDWESLNFLLPNEYKKVLYDVPQVSGHIKIGETQKPLFCLSPPMSNKYTGKTRNSGEFIASSSSGSTATQPSSGYRGSSTILTDSSTQRSNGTNPLYLYRYDSVSSEASLNAQDKASSRNHCPVLPKRSVSLPYGDKGCDAKVPPRPPLPKSILRKNRSSSGKRYSMFEMGGVQEVADEQSHENAKRMSLQEPYYMNNDVPMFNRVDKIIDSDKDVDEAEGRSYTGNYACIFL